MSQQLIRFDWAIKNILCHKANFGLLEGFLSELMGMDFKAIAQVVLGGCLLAQALENEWWSGYTWREHRKMEDSCGNE